MIKLKLTKQQLYCLCKFTNPAMYEAMAANYIRQQQFAYLDFLFNIIQIGEKATKLYLYGNKKKHNVSINFSEACSLLAHTRSLQKEAQGGYDDYVIEVIKSDLNKQITNYQNRFSGTKFTNSTHN